MHPKKHILPHARDKYEVLKFFSVGEEGLSDGEAETRVVEFGINTLPNQKKERAFIILLRQLHNPLIYILLASAIITFFLGKPIDSGVVFGVVILNSMIGFIQEYRAGKEIEALAQMVPEKVTITRNNARIEIDSRNVVPGDIVHLQSGDKVAADMRLLKVKNLHIEEAALTGESFASEKTDTVVADDAGVGDRVNMAFSGTLVTFGHGTGVVTATGSDTELGRIAEMLENATEMTTPLTKSMARIGKVITAAILLVATALFIVAYLRGATIVDALLASITLAVAAIPEGLPAVITIALAIGVRRMAARKAVIRRLPAVETLGSTSVICTDKTGTLTKNEMTVQELWTPAAAYTVSGVGYGKDGRISRDGYVLEKISDDLHEILKCGVLCNDSEIVEKDGKLQVRGDPTEAALIVAFQKSGGRIEELKKCNPRLDSIPFESERQYMATLNDIGPDNVIYTKGAPEVILKLVKEDRGDIHLVHQRITSFAKKGMRVLGFARKRHSGNTLSEKDITGNFEFLGLQAMIDPPREEAVKAIKDCHEAGITVKMITGDHKETAEAIAELLKITNNKGALQGSEIEMLSDRRLKQLASDVNVFARVAPEHKLRLVRALQDSGKVTAMTGDGVNDAPALKQADIGVAMGITGTSVSKEAADLILLDDNFATIRSAVEEGRRIFDNLIKSLVFVLPTNLGLALIILSATLFLPQIEGRTLMPILPVQILWINLVASVALALPLAFEAKEPDTMSRPPRPVDEPIFSSFVLWRTVMVAVLMASGAISLFLHEIDLAKRSGHSLDLTIREAQTMAVTTVIFFQIFYFLTCRSIRKSIFKIGIFSNPVAFLGIGFLITLHVGFVHLPIMNKILHSGPLPLEEWLKSMGVGFLVLPVIGLEKIIRHFLIERTFQKRR